MSNTAKSISASEPAVYIVPPMADCAAIQATARAHEPAPEPEPAHKPAPTTFGISLGCPGSEQATVLLCKRLADFRRVQPAVNLAPLTTGAQRQ